MSENESEEDSEELVEEYVHHNPRQVCLRKGFIEMVDQDPDLVSRRHWNDFISL